MVARAPALEPVGDLKSFDAKAFFSVSRAIEFAGNLLSECNDKEYLEVVSKEGNLGLSEIRFALTKIDAPMSVTLVDRILTELSRPDLFDREHVISRLGELSDRIKDELSSIEFVHIDSGMKELFSPSSPLFGKEVDAKFPSVIDEIAEAGKCLALDRSTAGAFHAIRTLEVGIRALARCLNIPDPTRASDRNWGATLRAIKDDSDTRWPGSSTRMSGDGQFFDQAYAALAAMQNPWRNATMHLDQKYTLEEARSVFDVVKGFMMKLASRMDENGDPKA